MSNLRVHRTLSTRLSTTGIKREQLSLRKVPYTTNSQEDNKNIRQDLKRQQRPINQMEAADEDDEHSDEDINQGF